MRKVARWMREHGLQLDLAKTEIVILSGRLIETIVPIRIGDQVIEKKPSAVYYLGVTIDTKLTFAKHLQIAKEKASMRVGQLSQPIANTRIPRSQARWLLMSALSRPLLRGCSASR